jgi:hypothetical protein
MAQYRAMPKLSAHKLMEISLTPGREEHRAALRIEYEPRQVGRLLCLHCVGVLIGALGPQINKVGSPYAGSLVVPVGRPGLAYNEKGAAIGLLDGIVNQGGIRMGCAVSQWQRPRLQSMMGRAPGMHNPAPPLTPSVAKEWLTMKRQSLHGTPTRAFPPLDLSLRPHSARRRVGRPHTASMPASTTHSTFRPPRGSKRFEATPPRYMAWRSANGRNALAK